MTSSISNTLLLIMNPRALPECLISLERLDVPKMWLRNYTEAQLVDVIGNAVEAQLYDRYVIIGDDCIVSNDALQAVLQLHDEGHPVVTGYCNLDATDPRVSLTKTPFKTSTSAPQESDYNWYSLDEIYNLPPSAVIPTGFSGMCFTVMSRELWQRFPFGCYGLPAGFASDYHLSLRLRDAGIPIVAPKNGFVWHTKPDWRNHEAIGRRRLMVAR